MKNNSKKLRCLIVDDELGAAEGLAAYVLKLDFLELADICLSAIEAAEVLKSQKVDLMFLDINMPHLSGIEFLESLDNAPLTIFTTAYSEYALDGFRLDVIDYLLKPIGFQRFFKAVSKAQQAITAKIIIDNNSIEDFSNIYIRQLDGFKRVDWRSILYAEAMQNYVKLYFQNELLVIHQTMNSLEKMLPADTFFRIHRSYLININHITSVSGGRVFISNKELPIAESRRNNLLDSVIYKNLISK